MRMAKPSIPKENIITDKARGESTVRTTGGKVPATFSAAFNQNQIITDAFDIAPGDNYILPAPEKAEIFTRAGHNDGCQVAVINIDLHIDREPQPVACADVDDFFNGYVLKP